MEELRAAGKLGANVVPKVSDEYKINYEQWRTYVGEVHPLSLFVAMVIWSRVHGIVSLEIQGNLPPFGEKDDTLYRFELNSVARQFIKE